MPTNPQNKEIFCTFFYVLGPRLDDITATDKNDDAAIKKLNTAIVNSLWKTGYFANKTSLVQNVNQYVNSILNLGPSIGIGDVADILRATPSAAGSGWGGHQHPTIGEISQAIFTSNP